MNRKYLTQSESYDIMYKFVRDFKNRIKTEYPDPELLALAIHTSVDNIHLSKQPNVNIFNDELEENKWYKSQFHICANRINILQ